MVSVTKGDADEGNATRAARTPTGETVAFRYEFRADHTFQMSVEVTGAAKRSSALFRRPLFRFCPCCLRPAGQGRWVSTTWAQPSTGTVGTILARLAQAASPSLGVFLEAGFERVHSRFFRASRENPEQSTAFASFATEASIMSPCGERDSGPNRFFQRFVRTQDVRQRRVPRFKSANAGGFLDYFSSDGELTNRPGIFSCRSNGPRLSAASRMGICVNRVSAGRLLRTNFREHGKARPSSRFCEEQHKLSVRFPFCSERKLKPGKFVFICRRNRVEAGVGIGLT